MFPREYYPHDKNAPPKEVIICSAAKIPKIKFFAWKSCAFEKFVVILQRKIKNMLRRGARD